MLTAVLTDAELTQLEQQKQSGINKNIERDWKGYYDIINAANRVICNIDSVPDPALTAAERKQWKAEGLILRSWRCLIWCVYGEAYHDSHRAPGYNREEHQRRLSIVLSSEEHRGRGLCANHR